MSHVVEYREQLDYIASLPAGWYDEQSGPVDAGAIAECAAFLARVGDACLRFTLYPIPGAVSGLQAEAGDADSGMEFSFYAAGRRTCIWYDADDADDVVEVNLSPDSRADRLTREEREREARAAEPELRWAYVRSS